MNRRFYLRRASWSAETPLYQGMSAVRDSEERSVSCEWARRRNYAGNYRSCFDHLLVAWAFCISCIHRVISHFARRRPRSPGLPFFVWEKGQHITAGTTLETRSEVARVRCRTISSFSLTEHLKEGKCEQCLAFFQQLNREQGMMQFLRESKN